jgi:hypothetical protein
MSQPDQADALAALKRDPAYRMAPPHVRRWVTRLLERGECGSASTPPKSAQQRPKENGRHR